MMVHDYKNSVKYIMYNCVLLISNMFAFSTISQTYFINMGLEAWQVGVFSSLANIMQAGTIFLSFWVVDRIKNIKLAISGSMYIMILFFVLMIALGYLKNDMQKFIFPIVFSAYVIYFACFGFKNVLDYRLPYMIMDMRDYGKVVNINGVVSNIIGVSSSVAFSYFVKIVEYNNLMMFCFILSAFLLMFAGNIINSFKIMPDYVEPSNNIKVSFEVFKEPSLLYLTPSHFVRGVSNGILGMTPILFAINISDDIAMSSILVVISSLAYIISCALYLWLSGKLKTTVFTAIGGLMMSLSLIMLISTGSVYTFYIFSFVATIGLVLIDNSVPIFLTEFIPSNIIGSYTSVRLLITMGGTALGSLLTGMFLTGDIGKMVMTVIGVLPVCGTLPFYFYDIFYIQQKANGKTEF